MIVTGSKLSTPLKTHGGKHYLARQIAVRMRPHRIYAEPFLGGGSVLLAKSPGVVEIASDANPVTIRIWRAIRRHCSELVGLLSQVDYRRETWEAARIGLLNRRHGVMVARDDDLVRVACDLIVNRMSREGQGKAFGWSDRLRGKRSKDGPKPGDLNAWLSMIERLPLIGERIKCVTFLEAKSLEVFPVLDGPDTLWYLDPPYLHETRSTRREYGPFEMTRVDHAVLLDAVRMLEGSVLLSGYDSPMYEMALAGWGKVTFDMPNHSAQGRTKGRRTECLWINPRAAGISSLSTAAS